MNRLIFWLITESCGICIMLSLYVALSCGIEGYFLSSASTQPPTFRKSPHFFTSIHAVTRLHIDNST